MPGLVANPKVERLISAGRLARGEIFLISNANIRAESGDLARLIEPFGDPKVGLVTTMFIGAGARSVGSAIESLHLLSFLVPGSTLATKTGAVCVVGKSMAIRREVCDQIGGFESFADVLAEDQAIGLAVKRADYRIAVAPVLVRNITEHRSIAAAIGRQIRWAKIRYSFSRPAYLIELMSEPFSLMLVALIAALALRIGPVSWLVELAALWLQPITKQYDP